MGTGVPERFTGRAEGPRGRIGASAKHPFAPQFVGSALLEEETDAASMSR
ncbi:hypothetical protein [Schaalia meyeri]|nr:hypothetical protein [Schaalia meyeri]